MFLFFFAFTNIFSMELDNSTIKKNYDSFHEYLTKINKNLKLVRNFCSSENPENEIKEIFEIHKNGIEKGIQLITKHNTKGFSFGVTPNELVLSFDIEQKLKEIELKSHNIALLSCGQGGLGEDTVVKFFSNKAINFIYHDQEDFSEEFRERTGLKTVLHKIISDIFELKKSDFRKLGLNKGEQVGGIGLATIFNSMHFYNGRNKDLEKIITDKLIKFGVNPNSVYNREKFLASNLICELPKAIGLKNGGKIFISSNSCFFLSREEINFNLSSKGSDTEFLNKYNFMNKLYEKNKNRWSEFKNKELSNFKYSEELNSSNQFFPTSLFPHDLFNEKNLNSISSIYKSVEISFPNTSEFDFARKITFDGDPNLLLELRKNPIALIAESFNSAEKFKEFIDSSEGLFVGGNHPSKGFTSLFIFEKRNTEQN